MATGAAEMILKCIFSGSISLNDMEIRRRPYHRNCKCALHKLKDICSDACPKQRSISFPKKQVRSDHTLSIATPRLSSTAGDSSMQNIGSLFLEGASETTITDNLN